MRSNIKLLLAAATGVVALAAAVGTANARRIELSERQFRQIWPFLEFRSEAGMLLAKCPVTLEGSFHSRTLSKVSAQLVGYITRSTVGLCATGGATALTEKLPWHIRYQSFGGTLPEIVSVTLQLVGAAWEIKNVFTCLAVTSEAHPAVGRANVSNGQVITLNPDSTAIIPTAPGCGVASVRFTGESEVFAGSTGAARIAIRLVA